jgi:hypothetical protein
MAGALAALLPTGALAPGGARPAAARRARARMAHVTRTTIPSRPSSGGVTDSAVRRAAGSAPMPVTRSKRAWAKTNGHADRLGAQPHRDRGDGGLA